LCSMAAVASSGRPRLVLPWGWPDPHSWAPDLLPRDRDGSLVRRPRAPWRRRRAPVGRARLLLRWLDPRVWARIRPLGAVAGHQSFITNGGGGAHLRPGGRPSPAPAAWRVIRHRHLRPGGRRCPRRCLCPTWVSVRGGGACFRSAGSSSALWMAGAVPWWPSCGHLGCRPWPIGLCGCCPGGSGGCSYCPGGRGAWFRSGWCAAMCRRCLWWHGRPWSPCANSCPRHRGGALGGSCAVASTMFRCSATTMQVKTLSS
jgi:hypothetical protein